MISDEAIKWPELNAHNDNYAPATNNGAAGFGNESEADFTDRSGSRMGGMSGGGGGYANSIAANSTPHLYDASADPYAVPPLPHLNPNQPYQDDPNASYYDPYRGPVPPSLHDNDPNGYAASSAGQHGQTTFSPGSQEGGYGGYGGAGGEAIPMTQLANRTRSPGPQYGLPDPRGPSPGPGQLGGRASPGPGAMMGSGRASPGPGAMMTQAGRASPGPYQAYDQGYGR